MNNVIDYLHSLRFKIFFAFDPFGETFFFFFFGTRTVIQTLPHIWITAPFLLVLFVSTHYLFLVLRYQENLDFYSTVVIAINLVVEKSVTASGSYIYIFRISINDSEVESVWHAI